MSSYISSLILIIPVLADTPVLGVDTSGLTGLTVSMADSPRCPHCAGVQRSGSGRHRSGRHRQQSSSPVIFLSAVVAVGCVLLLAVPARVFGSPSRFPSSTLRGKRPPPRVPTTSLEPTAVAALSPGTGSGAPVTSAPKTAAPMTAPTTYPIPAVSPTHAETKQILTGYAADLRAAFILAAQEGLTKRQVTNYTGLSADTVTKLARDWVIKFVK